MKENKVGLFGLIALVIGSMLGSGLFDLPSNMAHKSALGPILIALFITFVGMACLVLVFKELSLRKPKLDAGVYAYAKAGFGDYIGFNSAWGYWVSAWMGNIAFVIMLSLSVSVFFPFFGDGTNLTSLIFNSAIIWTLTALCISGIKSASFINLITTIAKLLALIIFFVFVFYAFDYNAAKQNVWVTDSGTTVFEQVKATMLVTLWIFIGVEGACVFSGRAKKREDIGKATIIGFAIVFCILFFISTLPFGLMNQKHLATLNTPSTAGVLEYVIGILGKKFIAIAIIISVLGALLSWILLSAEVAYVASSKDMLFPKVFAKVNSVGSPSGSLYITAIAQQIYLVMSYLNHSGYLKTLSLAASMILLPYLFSAAYALLLSIRGETYENNSFKTRISNIITNSIAVVYCMWLIYAAGITYLFLSSTLYGIGMLVYTITRIKGRNKVFTFLELLIALAILTMIAWHAISP